MRCFGIGLASSLVGFFTFGAAKADEPVFSGQSEDPQAIYGGETVAACGWPTTVSMEGACTATLVHPQVVVFAAHCGGGYKSIWMGENINQPARTLKPEFCKTFPGGGPGNGSDFAFCKLKEPVLDVPIVPILMGCETEILQKGQAVTIAGFGNADNGPYGIKRAVTTTISGLSGNEINIGGGGKDSCQGDSGGPVYVELPGIGWRVFGITSYGGQCGSGGTYSMMHNGVGWIEQEAGIDITPCHAADGSWAPGFGCKGFPRDPVTSGSGTWALGCGGGEIEGFSATCGAAFDPAPDLTLPTVSIISPIEGQMFMGEGGAEVLVQIDAKDVGWGVKEVHLLINGEAFAGNIDAFPPYEYALKFPNGGFTVGAQVFDLADNMGEAIPVNIGINGPAPAPEPEPEPEPEPTTGEGESAGDSGDAPTGGGPDAGSSGDSADDDSASGTAGEDDKDSGCGCRQGTPDAGMLALAGLGLFGWRRRR
ncbi:MAG: trypsin-like serine protease [Nannocystis sp.]|nr:trypsin-like serine protease [Nannocystis sp.]MBA3548448.1 trypsin-like serine protease [Nannocystis sp.]